MPDPEEILKKYARPVPRYTSYPTAPHFQQGLGEHRDERELRELGRLGPERPDLEPPLRAVTVDPEEQHRDEQQ